MSSGNGEPRVSEALLDAVVDTSLRTMDGLEAKVTGLETELAELRPVKAQALQENAALRETVARLEAELQDRDSAAARLKTALESNKAKVASLHCQRSRVEREMAEARELGEEDVECVKGITEKLENEKTDRLVRAEKKRAEQERRRMEFAAAFPGIPLRPPITLEECIEDHPALPDWKYNLQWISKELEECREKWRVLSGERKAILADLSRSAEVEQELRAELARVVAERDELAEQLRQAQAELVGLRDEVAGLNIDKTNLELDLQDMRERADILGQETENLEAVLEKQYHSAAELILQRDEARGERDKATAMLRALEEKVEPVAELLATLQDLYGVNNAKGVEEAARQDRRELAGLSEELELAHRDLEKKDRYVENIKNNLKTLDVELVAARDQIKSLLADRDERAEQLQDLLDTAKDVAGQTDYRQPENLSHVKALLGNLAFKLENRNHALAQSDESKESILRRLQETLCVESPEEVLEAAQDRTVRMVEAEKAKKDFEGKLRIAIGETVDFIEDARTVAGRAGLDKPATLEEVKGLLASLVGQVEQARARATAATVEVGQLITQRVELLEEASRIAERIVLQKPDNLRQVGALLSELVAQRNESRISSEANLEGFARDRDRLLSVGRKLAERFPGNPPENLQELAGLLSEVVVKKEETAGVLDGYRVLSRRRDLVLEAGRELARAHGEEPPEDLEELAALLGQLARQESSDGLPGREALLKESREQRELIHSLAHEVGEAKALAEKRGLETAEEVARVETLKKRLANQTDHLERLQAELTSLGEIFRQLQELYDVTPRAMVLAKAQAERNEVDTLRRELSETLAKVEDLKERLADQKEATEVADHDGGLGMERVAELERQLAEKDKVLGEKDGDLAALRWQITEKDNVLAKLQGLYEVSQWTDLPAASAILHRRFGEIVGERDKFRVESSELRQAAENYRQERDELAQRLRTQAAAEDTRDGDRRELDYLRGELRLVRSALLTALGREAEDNDEPVVPAQLRDMVVQLRSNRDHHRARDVRLSRELDEKHFDATANGDDRGAEFFRGLAATIRDERDRLKEERDRLKEDRDRLLQEERKALAQVESLERDLEAEVAQRAALKVERDHLARELAEAGVEEAKASSSARDLSSHLDAALAEMERLSGRFLESEAERYELWAERLNWSTENTTLLGRIESLERELQETRSTARQAIDELGRAEVDCDQEANESEALFHGLSRVCLEDVDIPREALDRCGCLFCQHTRKRLLETGYLPFYRGAPKPPDQEVDNED